MNKRIFSKILVMCFFLTGALLGNGQNASARPPHNDAYDNSVEQVIYYHKTTEARPDSVRYLSWSPVVLLDNGLYKVTVVFWCKNRFDRKVKKKQIVFLTEAGEIDKILDCR